MFIATSFTVALILSITSLICWGSWANSIKASKVAFQMFYFDYAIACLITSFFFASTFGTIKFGDDDSSNAFFTNLKEADYYFVLYAISAGCIFNAANLLLVNGIELVGLSVAFPIGIGTALVEGTILNYVIEPAGNVYLLFTAVIIATIAIFFMAAAYHYRTIEQDGTTISSNYDTQDDAINNDSFAIDDEYNGNNNRFTERLSNLSNDSSNSSAYSSRSSASSSYTEIVDNVYVKGFNKKFWKGLIICLVAGVLMGLWSPLSVKSMTPNHSNSNSNSNSINSNNNSGDNAVALTAYSSTFYFTLAVAITTFPFNLILIYFPLSGEPMNISDYVKPTYGNSYSICSNYIAWHVWAFVGGFIWTLGTLCNLVAGAELGFAISYALGQSAPMVGALWGLLFWQEFKNCSTKVYILLAIMFVTYMAAIITLSFSQ